MAWRAAVHRTYVANIERGVCNPSLSSIAKLATALGLTVTDLLAQMETAATPRTRTQASDAPAEIILITDNPAEAQLTMRALKKAGLANEVGWLRDAAATLEFFFGKSKPATRRPAPRLILLAPGLPNRGGLEILQRLKAGKRTASIPVVVLTASHKDRDLAESQCPGADAYVARPVDFGSLAELTPRLNLCWLLLRRPAREVV